MRIRGLEMLVFRKILSAYLRMTLNEYLINIIIPEKEPVLLDSFGKIFSFCLSSKLKKKNTRRRKDLNHFLDNDLVAKEFIRFNSEIHRDAVHKGI